MAESVFATKPSLVLEQGAGEGPAWHARYGLLFSGGGGINRLNDAGEIEPFNRSVSTNGLLFDSRGRLLRCENQAGRVTRLEPDGAVTVLTSQYDGARYNQPNDLTIDSQGRIYFSDPMYGPRSGIAQRDRAGREVEGVYRIDPDGHVARIIDHQVDRPNGVLVSKDDRYLFVADNNNNTAGGARILWRCDLRADGTLDFSTKKRIYDWGKGRGPDGMVQDDQSRLFVAGGLNRPKPPHESVDPHNRAGIYVFDVEGTLIDFVAIPRDEVTNCTLAGPDGSTLFITAGGTLWRATLRQ
jgi:gluconolactonase